MPAPIELASVLVSFSLIALAGARIGAGSHLSLIGLFAQHGRNDWPHGVQEMDVPRFAVEHADTLRHPAPDIAPFEELGADMTQATPPELVELHVHRASWRRDT
jgi:hypothetical protein